MVHRDVVAIVTPATFNAARHAIETRRTWSHSHAKREYLLRGLIVCGRDGHHLIGRSWRSAGNTRPSAYYCHECPKGERPALFEADVLEILWRDVLDFLAHPDEALRAMARTVSEIGSAEDRAERELVELARQLREIERQEEQLLELRLAKTITAAVLERKARELHAKRARANERIADVRAARAEAARAADETQQVNQLLADLRGHAEKIGEDPAARAEIVRTVTKAVVVHRASGRSRIQVTYAFGRALSQQAVRVASEQTS